MILIDAAKLEKNLDWMVDHLVHHDVVMTIKEQETVEAIPVKWLIDRFCNHRTIHTEKSMMREVYLKEIIRMWRKENESNTCD